MYELQKKLELKLSHPLKCVATCKCANVLRNLSVQLYNFAFILAKIMCLTSVCSSFVSYYLATYFLLDACIIEMFCLPLEAALVLTEMHHPVSRQEFSTDGVTWLRREPAVPTTSSPILIICRRFLGWVDSHFVIPIGNSTNTIALDSPHSGAHTTDANLPVDNYNPNTGPQNSPRPHYSHYQSHRPVTAPPTICVHYSPPIPQTSRRSIYNMSALYSLPSPQTSHQSIYNNLFVLYTVKTSVFCLNT